MNKVTLKVKKLREDVKLPTYKHEDDACFDFFMPENDVVGARAIGYKIPLGIAVEIPDGYYMEMYLRSSTGLKKSIRLSNHVGIIDAGYRDELCLILDNLSDMAEFVDKGTRIVQGQLKRVIPTEIVEVKQLSKSERGAGGLGSTGE